MPATGTRPLRELHHRIDRRMGGTQRRRTVVALAAVLAIDSSDKAAVGADAVPLQQALGIDRTQLGLLLALSTVVGALAVLPAGALVDRFPRVRMLSFAVGCSSVASLLSALAPGYGVLLGARLLLGVVTAVAGPAIASLIGDQFPAAERGRVYGSIASGELVGAGVGLLVTGQAAALSWRAPFAVLVPAILLVWWLVHRLPEPERGAQVAGQDPPRLSPVAAARRILAVRSNVVLVLASALSFFYFSGARGFAVAFARSQYGISQSAASALVPVIGIGALAGVLAGGRLADARQRRGHPAGRVEVAGAAVLLAAVLFVPALLVHRLLLGLLSLTLAATCLGATSPPLDAARLDINPSWLWGRADALRSLLRNGADAAAPLLFGVLSTAVFAGPGALRDTFLVALVVLVAAALVLLLLGGRTYPADAAAAGTDRDGAAAARR